MAEKRRGLGRGLGALIPEGPVTPGTRRPSDVFFAERSGETSPITDGRGFTGNITAPAPSDAPASALATTREPPSDEPDDIRASDGAGQAGSGLRPVPGATFANLRIDEIRANPRQPRQVFDDDDLAELEHSIREIGVLQPIVVRPLDEPEDGVGFELIMGERRWRASRAAEQDTVPAIIRRTADEDLLRDALLENLHRAQLNPLEEAAAYQQLLEDFGCTHDELAVRIGRSRPQISNTLRLMKLPPLVQRRVAAGVLSAGHARALLGLGDAGAMERLAQRIVAEGLSVRSVEEIVALGGDQEPAARAARRPAAHDPALDELALALSDRLDTRVGISMGRKKGKLTVEFASAEDLDRIIEALGLQR